MNELPEDILFEISSYLNGPSLFYFIATCTDLYNILNKLLKKYNLDCHLPENKTYMNKNLCLCNFLNKYISNISVKKNKVWLRPIIKKKPLNKYTLSLISSNDTVVWFNLVLPVKLYILIKNKDNISLFDNNILIKKTDVVLYKMKQTQYMEKYSVYRSIHTLYNSTVIIKYTKINYSHTNEYMRWWAGERLDPNTVQPCIRSIKIIMDKELVWDVAHRLKI